MTIENRNLYKAWNKNLPKRPRDIRTVFHFIEDPPTDEIPKLNLDDTEMLKELGYRYNRNGVLCQADSRGHLYPVDDRGVRKYRPRLDRPDNVEPDIWRGLTDNEKKELIAPAIKHNKSPQWRHELSVVDDLSKAYKSVFRSQISPLNCC